MLYAILTGYWPYRSRPFFSEGDTYLDYVDRVELLFSQRQYPDVTALFGGNVVMGCWMQEYTSAEQVLRAFDEQLKLDKPAGSGSGPVSGNSCGDWHIASD